MVNLLGTVTSQDDIPVVFDLVSTLDGVIEVQNNLQVVGICVALLQFVLAIGITGLALITLRGAPHLTHWLNHRQ